MKHIYLLIIAYCLSNGPALYAQEVITLRSALDSALSRNIDVRQADYQTALGATDLLQSRMDLLPSFSAGVSGNWNGGNYFDQQTATLLNESNRSASGSVGVSAVLFQGMQRIHQIKANKFSLEADKSNARRVRNALELEVVRTYIEALTNRDLLEASLQQLSLSQEQLKAEEVYVDVGTKTLADLSQAKSQVASDALNVTSSENAYALSLLTLKQLMEMDASREIRLETPALPEVDSLLSDYAAEDVYAEAVSRFPEIRQAEFMTQASAEQVAVARGAYYPSISLSGSLGTGYTSSARDPFDDSLTQSFRDQMRSNYAQSVGVSISIPIFTNFRSRIGVRRAKLQYASAKASEQQSKTALNKAVHQAVLDLKSADQQYLSSRQAFEALEETFEVIRQRYEVGLATSIELSTAQTNRNRAEFDFIGARYNLIFNSKVIDYYLGKPIRFD